MQFARGGQSYRGVGVLSLDSVTANAAWGKLEEDKEKHHWQIRLKKKKNKNERMIGEML